MTEQADDPPPGNRPADSPVDSLLEQSYGVTGYHSGGQVAPLATDGSNDESGSVTDGDGFSRRDVLKGGTLAALLGGGGYGLWQWLDDDEQEQATPPTQTEQTTEEPTEFSNLPFEVWREVRAVLKTSSTHLPARAERLVEDEDAEGLYDLVKEDIVTLPGGVHDMGEVGREVRWGPRTTLRSGAGTLREQAELLASLYEDMGYDTRLRVGNEPLSEAATKNLLYDPPDLEFDPDVDEETTEEWLDRLGTEPMDDERVQLDADGEQSGALGDSILEPLEPVSENRFHNRTFNFGHNPKPLVVEATDGDETTYADLFSPGASFGDPVGEPSAFADAPERIDPGTISMTLSGREARTGDVVEFVQGEWPVEVLGGRQVRVQTLASPDPIDVPTIRPVDVNQFHPALSLQGQDLTQEEAAEHSFLGDGFTRTGDRIAYEENALTRNGTPTVTGEDQTDPESIDSLSVTAVAEQFPHVRLELHPRDENRQPVGGLGPDAFSIEDNGESVLPTLVSNRPTPRVMVLYDASDSMPDQYKGDALETFVEELRADVKDIDEGAVVTTQSTEDWWHTGGWGSASHLWEFATKAPNSETNLLVYITDDRTWDERTRSIARQLRNGPPIIGLHSTASDEVQDGPLKEMATLSDGRAIPAEERGVALEAIREFISDAREDLPGYVVTYEATDRSGGEHTVSVETTASDSVSASTTYGVDQPDPFGFDRLRLTIEHTDAEGDTRSVTRTIAGDDDLPSVAELEQETEGEDDETETTTQEPQNGDGTELPEAVLDVEGALFGETIVSFEGWGLPFAVWADDLLGARMSYEGVHKAIANDDPEKANEHRQEEGLAALPHELMIAQSPYPDAVTGYSVTYPDGLRVAMQHQRPSFVSNAGLTSMDLLPLSRVTTAADDPVRRIKLTARRSARTAVVEREFYDRSAGTVLEGASLIEGRDLPGDAARSNALEALSKRAVGRHNDDHPDRIRLLDEDGTGLVHWELDPGTGAVRGILPDASGGGSTEERVQELLDRLSRIYAVMNLYITAAGAIVGGPVAPGSGVLVAYMKFLAKLYGIATVAIATANTEGIEDEIFAAVSKLLCRMATGVASAVVKSYGRFEILQALMTSTGEPPPAVCSGGGDDSE